MRIAGGLILLLLCLTSGARGQVSVDLKALDLPGAARPAPARRPAEVAAPVTAPLPPRARRPALKPAPIAATPRQPAVPTATAAGQPVHPGPPPPQPGVAMPQESQAARGPSNRSPGSVPAPSVASSQPGAAVPPDGQAARRTSTGIAGPVANAPPLPVAQPAMPPAVTMTSAPAPSPLPLPPPVRLVFEAGKTDLTPADEAAIQGLARAIPTPAAGSVNVLAYAAGKPDDPSTARRLSLSRGLAVRSVLLASGVPSSQIYVRALGSTASDGPADRVELNVAPNGTVTR